MERNSLSGWRRLGATIFLGMTFGQPAESATTYTNQASGNWTGDTGLGGTWIPDTTAPFYPVAGDTAIINGGFTVISDTDNTVANLNLAGTSSGTLTVNANTLKITGSPFSAAITGGSTGTVNIHGGTLKYEGSSFALSSSGSIGVWNQDGGLFEWSSSSGGEVGGGDFSNGGTFTLNLTGGTFRFSPYYGGKISAQGGGTATWNIGGGTNSALFEHVDPNSRLFLNNINSSLATVNLFTNGTMKFRGIAYNSGWTGRTAFNFNGGTMLADASRDMLTNGFTTGTGAGVFIKEGGGILDSSSNSPSISSALLHGGAAATDGGITKMGSGTWTLNGTNTYTGVTKINQGVLKISGAYSLTNSSSISVSNGAVLDVSSAIGFVIVSNQVLAGAGAITGDVEMAAGSVLSPDGTNTAGMLTLSNMTLDAGVVYNWQYDSNLSTGDMVNVTGTLMLPTNGTVNIDAVTALKVTHGILFRFVSCPQTDLSGWTFYVAGRKEGSSAIKVVNGIVEWRTNRGTVMRVQ